MPTISESLLLTGTSLLQSHTGAEGKLIVVSQFPKRTLDVSILDQIKRERAEAELRTNKIFNALKEVQDKMSPDRTPAVDFGFVGIGDVAAGAIRWAPQISPESDNEVISKAVMVKPRLGTPYFDVYYAAFLQGESRKRTHWERVSPQKESMSRASLAEVIRFATTCAIAKIGDNRTTVDGISFEGYPGIGKVG